MNNISFFTEHARENVLIDGKEYSFIIFISKEDCFKLIELLKHAPNDCRQAIAEYIRTRLDISENQKPSTDCIATQDNNFFAHIFELICQDDETLKELYDNNIDDSDICHRFITALNAKFGDNLSKQFTPYSISKAQIPQVRDVTFEVSKSLNYQLNKISKIAANTCTNTNHIFYEFTHWYDNLQYSFDIINQIGNTFSESLQSIYVPKLSDERKEQLRNSHVIWGEFGWTQPPFAPETFLDTPPIDQKNANKEALKYCTRMHMEKLFSALLDLSHAKKSDINEAVLTFHNKQYKSCALILFSLIDARLIRLQHKEDRKKTNNYRKVGKGAAKTLFSRIAKQQNIQTKTFMLFSHENIIHCLLSTFAEGNDFKVQPDVINRNFLNHGMLIRKVTRKDCAQLFLLYYNLLDYLDIIYSDH